MALLRLNDEGRLCLKGADHGRPVDIPVIKDVLLLIDTSGSMAGPKLDHAKAGSVDFARLAHQRGYATGLAIFGDRAAMVCDPTIECATIEAKVTNIKVGIVGGTTNLTSGLDLANKFTSLAAVVVVTDGQPNCPESAILSGARLKTRGVEIICIGTEDADKSFLDRLATRKDLARQIDSKNLRTSLSQASHLLLNASR